MNIIPTINNFLAPLDTLLKKHRKYVGYFIIFLALCSFSFFLFPYSTKESGEKAILVLWIILWLPIFARVLDINIAKTLMPLRKELGILMGILAIVHGAGYIAIDPAMLGTREFWITNGYPTPYAFGYFGFLLIIPLLLTSNIWAMKKLGKYWKLLHKLVYIIVILVVIHVVMIKYFIELDLVPVAILVLYFIGKVLEWKGISLKKG